MNTFSRLLLGIPFIATLGCHARPETQVGRAESPEESSWLLLESKDPMDNTPMVSLTKSSSPPGALLRIRCASNKTDAFVETGTVIDDSCYMAEQAARFFAERTACVRTKFDESAPADELWIESKNNTALFTNDPLGFARRLGKTHSFKFEYTVFEGPRRVVSFDVSGLEPKLTKISEACAWDAVDRQTAAEKASAQKRQRH